MIEMDGRRIRRIRANEHDLVFECLEDWPEDGQGPFTMLRALNFTAASVKENLYAEYPLTEDSDYYLTCIVETVAGNPLGVLKYRIWGKTVWVVMFALRPSVRGQRHMSAIALMGSRFNFEIMGAEKAHFMVNAGIPAVEGLIDKYTGLEYPPEAIGRGKDDTDKPKRKWEHDRAAYDLDKATAFVDNKGDPIPFDVIEASVTAKKESKG